MTNARCDLFIIGAGPAGMSAAIAAAGAGLSVVVADENEGPGGQVYRAAATAPASADAILGPDYGAGRALARDFLALKAERHFGASVFMVEARDDTGQDVGFVEAGAVRIVRADTVLIATGALERPFPVPGWTLPGVMTAGAAQTLLKAGALAPEPPVVLAGTGPLLILLAAQYARAGVAVSALLDTTPRGRWKAALALAPGFLLSPYRAKGLALLREARRATRIVGGVTMLAAEGTGRLEAVRFTTGGREERLPASTLLLHQGVVPQINLAMALGIRHAWNRERLCFEPVVGPHGQTEQRGLFIAGDSGGIGGAEAARASGTLAALAIAERAGRTVPDLRRRRAEAERALARALRGRAFLDRYFQPAATFRLPADDVTICRCEEVAAGTVRALTRQGAQGPNQLKAFSRAGMGPCQGRLCGLTVTEIMAREKSVSPGEIGHYRLRMPVKPVTVGQMAGLVQRE